MVTSSSSPKPAIPIQGGSRTRRSSLQVCTNLTKVKKESQVPYFKTLFANPNEQDIKGITPLMHLERIYNHNPSLNATQFLGPISQ